MAVGVSGAVLVVGLVQLVAPRGGDSITEVATQSATWPGATPRDSRASSDPTSSTGPIGHPTTTAGHHARPSTLSTMMLARSRRTAVPVGDGRHALTTANSLSLAQVLEVHIDDGGTVMARVKSINTAHTVAVLDLERPMKGAARRVAADPPVDGGRVYLGSDGSTAVVRQTASGFVLDTRDRLGDGSPILDEDGMLLGLAATDSTGVIRLVAIPPSSALDALVLVIDVWLGIRFEADSLRIADVQTGAPAEASGVRAGDRLDSIAGIPLDSVDDLWSELAHLHPGQTVRLGLDRRGESVVVEIELAKRPA
jgi:hypothetical protein